MAERAENENIHKGHRQRMLKKYLMQGIDCFADHEVLEILLYMVFSRRDTNELGHRLLERFHSIEGVLNASVEALCEVDGIGETAATYINFVGDLFVRLNSSRTPDVNLTNSEDLKEYCYNMLRFEQIENTWVIFLSKNFALKGKKKLSTGREDSVDFDMHTLLVEIIKSDCTNIVLTHNHPNGAALPSGSDVAATRRIASFLSDAGINLVDHIIVNHAEAFSMRSGGHLKDIWG